MFTSISDLKMLYKAIRKMMATFLRQRQHAALVQRPPISRTLERAHVTRQQFSNDPKPFKPFDSATPLQIIYSKSELS